MAISKDQSQMDINVILLGETGTGKSTLINYLVNLFYDGSLTNMKIAIPTRYFQSNMSSIYPEHHENNLTDVIHCKTNQCAKYSFEIKQVRFNFIDTPGINAAGGYLEDNSNFEKIFHCIQSFDCLHALVLIFNGTQARLTINIKTIVERFRERLPNIFHSNILLLLTHCSRHTVNFQSIDYLPNSPIFYMQNSAFSTDPQTWTDRIQTILQRDWTRSIETMNELIKTLVLLTPISTESLHKLHYQRDIIRSILHECRLMIMELQYIEDELAALEQAAQIYSENLTQTKIIQVNEISPTSYHNTICLKCNVVCHERCSLNEVEQIGNETFRHCEIMNNGRCTVCPSQCSAQMHYHDRRLIKQVSRTIRFAISSLSNRFHEIEEEKIACEIQCRTFQEGKHLIEQLLQEQYEKIEDIYRNVNIFDELCTCINILRNELKFLRSKYVIDKAKKFIEQLEYLANHRGVNQPKKRRKRKVLVTKTNDDEPMSSIRIEDRSYSEYSTEHLIELIRQSMTENILIEDELNRRCQSASLACLTPQQLLNLCEYYTSIQYLTSNELNCLYERFQRDTSQSSIDKLIHSTAINLCLQNQENTSS